MARHEDSDVIVPCAMRCKPLPLPALDTPKSLQPSTHAQNTLVGMHTVGTKLSVEEQECQRPFCFSGALFCLSSGQCPVGF
eukprot:245842-Amphidinium_carterae.1